MRQCQQKSIDFNQDLEVMDKLIASNPLNTSIQEMFGDMISKDNKKFLRTWADLNKADDLTIKRNKSFCYKKDNGKIAAQVLLLLTYMMVSSVMDERSIATQM